MQIVFPTSTEPSLLPTECGGRLINWYAEEAPEGSRSQIVYRRAPGLDLAFTAGIGNYRGAIRVGTVLYIINGETCFSVTKAGSFYTVTPLGGVVARADQPGTDADERWHTADRWIERCCVLRS